MLLLGDLVGKAPVCVCKPPKTRHSTASFRPLGSQAAICRNNALYRQHNQIPRQLKCSSRTRTAKRQYSTVTQAASAAQQPISDGLAGTGAGRALPSMQVACSTLSSTSTLISMSAGFINWVNTSKPPKYLWRTLAALLMGGQALVRILQGARIRHVLLHCALTQHALSC